MAAPSGEKKQRNQQEHRVEKKGATLSLTMEERDTTRHEPKATIPFHTHHHGSTMIPQITSLQDYDKALEQARDHLVVVRFYSPFCTACNAIRPRYERLFKRYHQNASGKGNTDALFDVRFLDVPVSRKNAEVHERLGIRTIPCSHIHHPQVGGWVEESLSLNSRVIRFFEQRLKSYIQGSCPLPAEVDEKTQRFESPYTTTIQCGGRHPPL